jgi:hypothetical protein
MGLDQFARTVDNEGNKVEIAYWRKHPNLQGWMENLWEAKGKPGVDDANMGGDGLSDFNCIPLELNSDDLDDLEDAVRGSGLPSTTGFFFGRDSDDYYKQQDLEFIRKAREALDSGLTVVYNSWW